MVRYEVHFPAERRGKRGDLTAVCVCQDRLDSFRVDVAEETGRRPQRWPSLSFFCFYSTDSLRYSYRSWLCAKKGDRFFFFFFFFFFFYDIRKGRREMKCVNGSKMFGLREKKSGTNWLALAGITQLVTSHVRLLLRFRARLSFPPQMLSQRTPGCTSDTLQLYCLFSRAFSSSTFSFSPFPLSFSFYLGAAAI